VCLAAGAATGVAVYVGLQAFEEKPTRSISVCVVTDVPFRLGQPNWQYKTTLWFAEVNRMFAPSGVQFRTIEGGEAYPETTAGGLLTGGNGSGKLKRRADIIL
jgi:hypothetical protein